MFWDGKGNPEKGSLSHPKSPLFPSQNGWWGGCAKGVPLYEEGTCESLFFFVCLHGENAGKRKHGFKTTGGVNKA